MYRKESVNPQSNWQDSAIDADLQREKVDRLRRSNQHWRQDRESTPIHPLEYGRPHLKNGYSLARGNGRPRYASM